MDIGAMAYSEDYADFIIEYNGDMEEIEKRYQPSGIQEAGRFLVIYKNITSERTISIEQFGYRALPKCFGLLSTDAAVETGAVRVRRQPYLNLYGQGVLVALIDTGIDYTHPVFRNEDGTSRILSIWDQTEYEGSSKTEKAPATDGEENAKRAGRTPEGIHYGTEYTKEEIDRALRSSNPLEIVPEQDETGHGTFLAGVMAGNEEIINNFSGIAPYAGIIAVKLKQAKKNLRFYYKIPDGVPCYAENDILMGVRYILNKATEYSRPVVLCLGLGTNQGGHDGLLPLSVYMGYFGEYRGVGMVAAAGNETNRGHHFRGQLTKGDSYLDVEINVGEREKGFSLEMWGTVPALFSIGIISPTGEIYSKLPVIAGQETRLDFLLDGSRVYVVYRLIEKGSGEELIFIRFEDPSAGIWKIRVYLEKENMGIFDMWLPMYPFIRENTFFLRPDPDITVCEPGNTDRILTVAGYQAENGGIYLNSSRGYTRTNQIVPDVAAPAVDVFGPVPGNRYAEQTGTSIAAAVTAGICALLFEWGIVKENDLDMDTKELTKLLIRGAGRGNLVYPNREWGYGTVSVYGVFESIRIT